MSTKAIEEALELLSGFEGSMGTLTGREAVGAAVASARKEVGAIHAAAKAEQGLAYLHETVILGESEAAARRLWRSIAEESK